MIVFFILFFKTAVTPQKGIENLRVAISSDDTLGDFQVRELVIHPEESTKSSTTTGIKGLVILFINVFGLYLCARSYSILFLYFIHLLLVWLFSLLHYFAPSFLSAVCVRYINNHHNFSFQLEHIKEKTNYLPFPLFSFISVIYPILFPPSLYSYLCSIFFPQPRRPFLFRCHSTCYPCFSLLFLLNDSLFQCSIW